MGAERLGDEPRRGPLHPLRLGLEGLHETGRLRGGHQGGEEGRMIVPDPVRPGGLFRCCMLTIEDREAPGKQGEIQPCDYCDAEMIFTFGAWEWKQP